MAIAAICCNIPAFGPNAMLAVLGLNRLPEVIVSALRLDVVRLPELIFTAFVFVADMNLAVTFPELIFRAEIEFADVVPVLIFVTFTLVAFKELTVTLLNDTFGPNTNVPPTIVFAMRVPGTVKFPFESFQYTFRDPSI